MLILGYHRVNPEARDGLSVTPASFEAQLAYLHRHGWENVNLEEALVFPKVEKGAKRFAITLDDGFQDNYLYALPVLKRMGMRATLFVATAYLDSGQPFPWVQTALGGRTLAQEDLPLTWAQLEEMANSQVFTIGSHTLTHPFLSQLGSGAAEREISESKGVLEERLDRPVSLFCYPSGDFNDETIRLVSRAGYAAAVVSPDRYIPETPFTLHRICVDRETTHFLFRVKTNPLFAALEKSRRGWRVRAFLRAVYRRGRGQLQQATSISPL